MIALRLAEFTGWTDEEAMLSGMSPKTWQRWKAKHRIQPIGTDIQVCEILTKIGMMLAAFVGVEATEESFMPWKLKPKADVLTPKQSRVAVTNHLRTVTNGEHR